MKRRLFIISLFVIVLCVAFAVSASAEITTYDDVTKNVIKVSTDDLVVFDDGFTCPSAYIAKDQKLLSLDFSYLQTKGKTYTVENIVELDIPEGTEEIYQYYFTKNTTLKKCSIPASVTKLQQCIFQQATGIEELVFEHTEASGLDHFPNWMVWGCTSLKALSMPDCITKMSGVGQFQGCTNLTAVYLSKNLQSIESGAGNTASFGACPKLFFVNEPFTYDNIPTEKPEVYYFPENLASISSGGELFKSSTNLNNTLVFPEGLTELANGWAFCGSNAINVVFLGDMVKVSTTGNAWNSSIKIYFCNKNDISTDSLSMTTNASKIFCNAEGNTTHLESPRDADVVEATCYSNEFLTKHCFCGKQIGEKTETPNSMLDHEYIDDFDCTTKNLCKNYNEEENVGCKAFLDAEAESHNETHDVIFNGGFTNAGIHNTYCSNSTCTQLDASEDLDAMFTPDGYSYKERGVGGVSAQFKINTYALKLYEKYEGTLHFGIMIANASHFENVDAFIENGELTSTNDSGDKSGVIVEMTSRNYDYFNCFISGFDMSNAEHTSLPLVIAGYVYGDNGEIVYIQKQYKTDTDDTTIETPYASTVTKDATLGAVTITLTRDFVPLPEADEQE